MWYVPGRPAPRGVWARYPAHHVVVQVSRCVIGLHTPATVCVHSKRKKRRRKYARKTLRTAYPEAKLHRRLFSPGLRILSSALQLASIRNVNVQPHKIPFGLDAVHILDEPALLLLLHHVREEVIERLTGALQPGDLRPYFLRDGDPFRCSHDSIVSFCHTYNVARG